MGDWIMDTYTLTEIYEQFETIRQPLIDLYLDEKAEEVWDEYWNRGDRDRPRNSDALDGRPVPMNFDEPMCRDLRSMVEDEVGKAMGEFQGLYEVCAVDEQYKELSELVPRYRNFYRDLDALSKDERIAGLVAFTTEWEEGASDNFHDNFAAVLGPAVDRHKEIAMHLVAALARERNVQRSVRYTLFAIPSIVLMALGEPSTLSKDDLGSISLLTGTASLAVMMFGPLAPLSVPLSVVSAGTAWWGELMEEPEISVEYETMEGWSFESTVRGIESLITAADRAGAEPRQTGYEELLDSLSNAIGAVEASHDLPNHLVPGNAFV